VKVNCGNNALDTYLPVWWICDATCTKLLNRRGVYDATICLSGFREALGVAGFC